MVDSGRYITVRRTLTLCRTCERVEFMVEAGPFFWRCSECYQLQAKELD